MLNGHGGNIYDMALRLGCSPYEIIDMSSNVNPLGPMPGLVTHLKDNIKTIAVLPEVDARSSAQAFADRYNIDHERIIAGNGTTQFIFSIPLALGTKKALILGPTYADYADACIMHKTRYNFLTAKESTDFKPDINDIEEQITGHDTVFICNPNNPTGVMISFTDLERLCRSHPNTYFVIDESYLPFADGSLKQSMMWPGLPNVIVLNSLSKVFRTPGLRIGFLISSREVIEKFRTHFLPWSVNSLAQAAVYYLMTQKTEVDTFIKTSVKFIEEERNIMLEKFKNASRIKFFPSRTSFLLAKLHGGQTAINLSDHLFHDKILIRNCSNFVGLSDRFIRISLKTSEINRILSEKLLDLI